MTMARRNIRRTGTVLIFVVFPVGYCLLGYLWGRIHWVFGFVLVAFVVALLFLLRRMRCPKCGAPIGRATARLFGVERRWWWLVAPPSKNCERCGYDLTGKESAGDGGC